MKMTDWFVGAALFAAIAPGCSSPSSEGRDAASDVTVDASGGLVNDVVPGDTAPDRTEPPSDAVPDQVADSAPDTVLDVVPEDTGDDAFPDVPPDTCQPDCEGKVCGDNGCGGSCGDCMNWCDPFCNLPGVPFADPSLCMDDGTVCAQVCCPNCCDRECGDDGCGGLCGQCEGMQEVCDQGQCVCQPACDGKECGEDGCGGGCGECSEHFACADGLCVYQPWCGDGTCDTDLLEDCETCTADCPCGCGETCADGTCAFMACEGKECGENGCGGSCGICPGAQDQCLDGQCICQPACEGKQCGDDGCGGQCGPCPNGEACNDQFQCLAGTWYDETSGLTWVNQIDSIGGGWDQGDNTPAATAFCQNLQLAGLSDWRLPTISELRTLIRGCPGTETGGACGVTDGCLDSSCKNQSCHCQSGGGPAGGCYWPDQLKGDCGKAPWPHVCDDMGGSYWSFSPCPNEYHWNVRYCSASVFSPVNIMGYRVRCVR